MKHVTTFIEDEGDTQVVHHLRYERDEAWTTLVSFLGLPAEPRWASYVLGRVEKEKRIQDLDGIGCQPVLISATAEEILGWVSNGVRSQALNLPGCNGPIRWPSLALEDLLRPQVVEQTA